MNKKLEALETVLESLGFTRPDRARILRAAGAADTPGDTLITTREAANILACHTKTVLFYGRSGVLHPIRRSKRWLRWRESEVVDFAFGKNGQ